MCPKKNTPKAFFLYLFLIFDICLLEFLPCRVGIFTNKFKYMWTDMDKSPNDMESNLLLISRLMRTRDISNDVRSLLCCVCVFGVMGWEKKV